MRLHPFFAVALLVPLSTSTELLRAVLAGDTAVRATRVALDAHDPARSRVGGLVYLGGVRLSSRDPAFGGFSAMRVEGERFTLLSDSGNVVRFRMGGDWQPRDIGFADLAEGPGIGGSKLDRDSESLAVDPAGGKAWVGFEQSNTIFRYDAGLARAERWSAPKAMRDWSVNGGPEAMVRLRSGRFIAISETTRASHGNGRQAVQFDGDPTEGPDRGFEFTYIPPAGFNPSDLTELPDGRLLVLNRRFAVPALFTAKLVLIDPRAIRPGAAVAGREIAHLAAPLLHDNFEAVAAVREGKDTILWIASDDNQQFWQRSLLLKFRLEL